MNNTCPASNSEAIKNLFSAWDTPEDRNPELDCRCPDILDFPQMGAVIRDFISEVLKHPEYFEESVRKLIESKAPEVSIMSVPEAEKVNYLPTISVEFGGAESSAIGFDGEVGNDSRKGTYTGCAEWRSQYTVDVIAKTRYETFLLATSLARLFLQGTKSLKERLQQKTFTVARISKPSLRSEENSSLGYVVQITLGMSALETWKVIELAPVLKRIEVVNQTKDN